ncbi:hypothetical protein [Methylophaga nitratireducenticrescens]|nr:hypothetical protein [Methylophaga nitratireducenticrescens]
MQKLCWLFVLSCYNTEQVMFQTLRLRTVHKEASAACVQGKGVPGYGD